MITLEVNVNQTINAQFQIEEIIDAINELQIAPRINAIARIINGISTDDFEALNIEKQNIVINYFERKLTEFKAIQNS